MAELIAVLELHLRRRRREREPGDRQCDNPTDQEPERSQPIQRPMHAYAHNVRVAKLGGLDEGTPFYRWFGRSIMRNREGLPKIVFHGTRFDIAVFGPMRRSGTLGFHFGSTAQAEMFAGYHAHRRRPSCGCIMPVYLRIERPLRMPDIFGRGRCGSEGIADWLFDNRIIDKAKYGRIYNARSASAANDCIVEGIEGSGFDGIIYENEHEGGTATSNEDSYIVFRPQQIKSVFNRGTFDPESPNISE